MRISSILQVCLLILLGLVCCSWLPFSKVLSKANQKVVRPPIFAVYTPYPQESDRMEGMTPLPAIYHWTPERMQRDMQRMLDCHINGVLLALTPAQLADSYRRERIKGFLELAEQNQFRIVFYLLNPTPLKVGLTNLGNFLTNMKLLSSPALYREQERPVILFDESIQLFEPIHPAFLPVFKGVDWIPTVLKEPSSNEEPVSDQVIWIYAALAKDAEGNSLGLSQAKKWTLPRTKGKSFEAQLTYAFAQSPRLLILSSWNTYTDGSAIEKNSFDADSFALLLKSTVEACTYVTPPQPEIPPFPEP